LYNKYKNLSINICYYLIIRASSYESIIPIHSIRVSHRRARKSIGELLEELIRKSKISELKNFKGKVNLDIDLNNLQGRQCRY